MQESLQGNVEINFPLEMLLFICCLPPDLTLKIAAVRERREGEELFCIALLVVVSESLTAARILFF